MTSLHTMGIIIGYMVCFSYFLVCTSYNTSVYSTCIEANVHSIRYFDCQKWPVAFFQLISDLHYICVCYII